MNLETHYNASLNSNVGTDLSVRY